MTDQVNADPGQQQADEGPSPSILPGSPRPASSSCTAEVTPDELAYRDELESLAGHHPATIAYVPTVSRPTDPRNRSWRGSTGRVNTLVEHHVARLDLSPSDTAVYACGHPGMIEDVARRLAPRGFTVREERYWTA